MQKHTQQVWDKVLSNNEELKFEFSISERYIKIATVLYCLILLPTIIGPFLMYWYFQFYLKRSNIYGFTNKRVLIHKGWLSSHTTSIDYSRITDIRVNQTFLEKILINTGSILINTSGSGDTEVVLTHLDNPYEIRKKLDALRDEQ